MASTASKPDSLPARHRAILLTVLYSDLFDHPLTVEELHRFLMAPCPDRETLERDLGALNGRYLHLEQGFLCWRGREATIEVRRRRQRLAAGRWPPARRFARWLGWVPFLRMVAVCGSQAMENGDEDGDVDLFLITVPGRLWLAQSLTMVLRRAGRRLGVDFCPNYLLTEDALEIGEHDLYTAREATQAVPLWGREAHFRFLDANRWIESFLPQHGLPDDRSRFLEPRPRHRLTSAVEWLLGGRLGELLDRAVHRVLLRYYRLRLKRHGWSREEIESAYRRDRQMVITGGYAAAVAERFVEHGLRELGGQLTTDELESCFYGTDRTTETPEVRETPDPLYAGLMAARYGGSG